MIGFAGILLSSEVLRSGWFQALATFVAIDTLVFAAISIARTLPPLRRSAPPPPNATPEEPHQTGSP